MSQSYKDKFKEESEKRRRNQKQFFIIGLSVVAVIFIASYFFFSNTNIDKQNIVNVPKQTLETKPVAPIENEQTKNAPESSKTTKEAAKPVYNIIVDKGAYKLYLQENSKTIKTWNIAVGAKPGQKQRAGDMTTPTGKFEVDEILDASYWTHDFGDGKGEIKGAYGPNFISLITGWDGIGIHGTHAPESIGTMVSEGCVRMRNEELLQLLPYVDVGTKVEIRE